ncbi:MAG: replication-associated recombination protein A [Bacillota bacterium]
MDLFRTEEGLDAPDNAADCAPDCEDSLPLAERMRPRTLDEIVGADHILGPSKWLRILIEADRVPSMILYGRPGTGKTTIARVIARVTKRRFYSMNAVMSGVADIRRVVDRAQDDLKARRRRSILFIDEIHRFNKAQQDALLPFVESGVIALIGATTENPMFSLVGPLLSRTRIVELNPLTDDDISLIVKRGLQKENEQPGNRPRVAIQPDALGHLVRYAGGDARVALNILEAACYLARDRAKSGAKASPGQRETGAAESEAMIDLLIVEEASGKTAASYDRSGDNHYDIASALIKSIRGSDPQAAVYWLGRMIYAGEDPRFIARRLVISASEDIGMANPNALLIAEAAAQAVERIGMPEARIILAHVAIFLASSAKSNSAYIAIERVLKTIEEGGNYQVPNHLRDASYRGASRLGRGKGYKYPHDYPGHYVKQQYLPDQLANVEFYTPSDQGYERRVSERLNSLRNGG